MSAAKQAQRTPHEVARKLMERDPDLTLGRACEQGYQIAYKAARSLLVKQQVERNALVARVAELEAALRDCAEVVKVWHAADDVWQIYFDHSPEMASTRAALAKEQS